MVETPKRETLTRERVLEGAVALADEIGIEALTIRKLAAALGTKPMTIYYHVPSKEEIIDGMVEIVFAYPGVGGLLAQSILHSDFYVLNAVVFCIIFGIAFGTLVLDLVYPLLDPRITYERA